MEIQVYSSPWVSRTRAQAYFGPISAEYIVRREAGVDLSLQYEKGMNELRESICTKARELGANSVIGCERTVDPFFEDQAIRLHIVGTAARLEDMFSPEIPIPTGDI